MYSSWEDYQADEEAWERKRPTCAVCEEKITTQDYYLIGSKCWCPACFKEWADERHRSVEEDMGDQW